MWVGESGGRRAGARQAGVVGHASRDKQGRLTDTDPSNGCRSLVDVRAALLHRLLQVFGPAVIQFLKPHQNRRSAFRPQCCRKDVNFGCSQSREERALWLAPAVEEVTLQMDPRYSAVGACMCSCTPKCVLSYRGMNPGQAPAQRIAVPQRAGAGDPGLEIEPSFALPGEEPDGRGREPRESCSLGHPGLHPRRLRPGERHVRRRRRMPRCPGRQAPPVVRSSAGGYSRTEKGKGALVDPTNVHPARSSLVCYYPSDIASSGISPAITW